MGGRIIRSRLRLLRCPCIKYVRSSFAMCDGFLYFALR
jgi:hypothetical protein